MAERRRQDNAEGRGGSLAKAAFVEEAVVEEAC
jgi:hypothetical protein